MKFEVLKIGGRLNIPNYLNELKLLGTAVEVGVWRGDYSFPFRRIWKGSKLWLVDPWCPLNDYNDIRNKEFDEDAYDHVIRESQQFSTRIEILRAVSVEAASIIPDNLDFVYIDANHYYKYVLEDLNTWWPKIKPGGILGGHDIFNEAHEGVHKAVFEFGETNNLDAMFIADYPAHSYLFRKPNE